MKIPLLLHILLVNINLSAIGKPLTEDEFEFVKSVVPSGGTVLQESDTVLILVNKNNLFIVREIFSKQQEAEQ